MYNFINFLYHVRGNYIIVFIIYIYAAILKSSVEILHICRNEAKRLLLWLLNLPPGESIIAENSRTPGGKRLLAEMRPCLPNNTGWAKLRAWPYSPSSVTFFLENQAERRKMCFYPHLVLLSMFKTKRTHRSDVDISTDNYCKPPSLPKCCNFKIRTVHERCKRLTPSEIAQILSLYGGRCLALKWKS